MILILLALQGADVPETAVDELIEIPGVWRPSAPSAAVGPGAMMICKASTMAVGGKELPFSLGMMTVGLEDDFKDQLLISWWVLGESSAATMHPDKKESH